MDEEQASVPQVRVDLVELRRWTITDANGTFAFALVQPGTYKLKVSLSDLPPVTHEARVAAEETTTVIIHVKFPPITRAYHTTDIFEGLISCQVNQVDCPGVPHENDKYVFPLSFEPDIVALVAEVQWQAGIHERVSHFRIDAYINNPAQPIRSDFGPPPYLKINLTGADQFKDATVDKPMKVSVRGDKFDTLVFNHPYGAVLVNQKFTLYVTKFYREDQSAGFSAIPQ